MMRQAVQLTNATHELIFFFRTIDGYKTSISVYVYHVYFCLKLFLLIIHSWHQSRCVRAHGGSRIEQTREQTVALDPDGGELHFASRSEHFPLLISLRICLRWQFAFRTQQGLSSACPLHAPHPQQNNCGI